MATCDTQELIDASKCFACLQPGQAMAVELALLCRILRLNDPMAACDINELLNEGRCFSCLTAGQAMVVRLELLCEILNGGGGGTNCLIRLATNVAPAIAPPCPLSIAAGPGPNEGVWFGDSNTGVWEEIIAPGP